MNNFHSYDPFDALEQLGQRAQATEGHILQMAQLMEGIAGANKHQAEHLQHADNLLRHAFKLLQYQHDLIIKLDQRLALLEKK